MALKQLIYVVHMSPNGKDNWTLVKPEDFPEWLKNADVMERMVSGHIAQNTNGVIAPDEVRPWYRAVVVKGVEATDRLLAAHIKRKRKMARRVSTVH